MKKLLMILGICLFLFSCSTDEESNSTKQARVNIVSLYGLPTSVSLNNVGLPSEFHHGEAFEVKRGDVIKASGRQIWISINGEEVVNAQSYAEYIVE